MTCSGCAARVTKALEHVPGVDSVAVNFALKSGRVSGSVDRNSVLRAVEIAGYKAIFKPKSLRVVRPVYSSEETGARYRLVFSMLLAAAVMILAMLPLPESWKVSSQISAVLQGLLATTMILGPARGFFSHAIFLARHRAVNMDTLVAIGVGAAWLFSVFQVIGFGDHSSHATQHLYFESAVVIAAFVLLGRWLEELARSSAVDSIMKLASLQPSTATLRRETRRQDSPGADMSGLQGSSYRDEEVAVADVNPGDLMVVAAGKACPTDGVVYSGESEMDESLVSGESTPVYKKSGDLVLGGTLNCGGGFLIVRATKIGNDTMLSQIVSLVEDAQARRPAIQKIVDQVASRFVPGVLVLAVMTVGAHLLAGHAFPVALNACLAVLVIACPCALGLATPTAILAGSGRAARMGILVRDPDALQEIRDVNVLVIDKTGTVTTGDFVVRESWLDDHFFDFFKKDGHSFSMEAACALLSGVLSVSRHPLSTAAAKWFIGMSAGGEYSKGTSDMPQGVQILSTVEHAGRGIVARILLNGMEREIVSGNLMLMSSLNIPIDALHGHIPSGFSCVWIAIDRKLIARLALESELRQSAVVAVGRLKRAGIEVVMASGDQPAAVEQVALASGIGRFHSALLPGQKVSLVQDLQKSGKRVVMAGDGINDAPALAQADVGISVGRGTDIAMGTSGLIIPSGDLTRIADAIQLSRIITRVIRQNLFWAFGYNIVAIPIAAMGLLSPMIAAGAMAMSSVSVVLNSLRLFRFRPDLTK